MNLSLILFTIGILGFVLNRKNIILMLISIEIMLLAITFLVLVSSLSFDDILGQTYAIYIISIAGAESAIGLGILVAFYRLAFSLVVCFIIFNFSLVQNLVSTVSKMENSATNKIRSFSAISRLNYYALNRYLGYQLIDSTLSFQPNLSYILGLSPGSQMLKVALDLVWLKILEVV